jgi:hypothetical protein
MQGGFSPIKLDVVLVEKLKRWEKDGRSGQIAHIYAKLVNEMPDFPLYFVVFSPPNTYIAPGVSLRVPLSGIRITLGDPDVFSSAPFPIDDLASKSKKIP